MSYSLETEQVAETEQEDSKVEETLKIIEYIETYEPREDDDN